MLRAFKYTSGTWMQLDTESLIRRKTQHTYLDLPSPDNPNSSFNYENNIMPYHASFDERGFRHVNIDSNDMFTKEMSFFSNVPDRDDSRTAILGCELSFGRYNNDWESIGYFLADFTKFKFQIDVHASLVNSLSSQIHRIRNDWNQRPYRNVLILLSDDCFWPKDPVEVKPFTPIQKILLNLSKAALFKVSIDLYYRQFPDYQKSTSLESSDHKKIFDELTMFVEGLRLRSDIPTRILVTYLPHLRPILPMTVRNNVAFVPHYVPFEQLVHVSDQELFWQNPEINTLSRYGNIQIAKSLLGYIHAK